MTYKILIVLVATIILMVACDTSSEKLTQTDMNNLKVPHDFDFAMSSQVEVDIQGAWRLPLYLKTRDGNLLFKAQMNPETGISTKLTLPKTISEVVIHYQSFEVPVNVSSGSLNFDFRSDW
jgi:hypothetical protein